LKSLRLKSLRVAVVVMVVGLPGVVTVPMTPLMVFPAMMTETFEMEVSRQMRLAVAVVALTLRI